MYMIYCKGWNWDTKLERQQWTSRSSALYIQHHIRFLRSQASGCKQYWEIGMLHAESVMPRHPMKITRRIITGSICGIGKDSLIWQNVCSWQAETTMAGFPNLNNYLMSDRSIAGFPTRTDCTTRKVHGSWAITWNDEFCGTRIEDDVFWEWCHHQSCVRRVPLHNPTLVGNKP